MGDGLAAAADRQYRLMYRSYGPDTTCEREESGTSTVDRYGTQGGPPGRMILAQ